MLAARNQTRGVVLAERTLEARTAGARLKGLLGRTELPRGEALWICPCNSIHTLFMRFPIDVLFLTGEREGERRVVRAVSRLRPWRATRVYLAAESVLELWAGAIDESGSREGDLLQFRKV